jgi:hypothetical protein
MKPGWKTTEFWATLVLDLGAVAAAAGDVLPDKYAALAATVATAAYAISRGLAKKPV